MKTTSLSSITSALQLYCNKCFKTFIYFKILNYIIPSYSGIIYEYYVPSGTTLKKDELEMFTRLCLGKQIVYYMGNKDSMLNCKKYINIVLKSASSNIKIQMSQRIQCITSCIGNSTLNTFRQVFAFF